MYSFSQIISVEWASFGARVNSISPGYILTDIADFADPEMKKEMVAIDTFGKRRITTRISGGIFILGLKCINLYYWFKYCC